MEHPRDDVPAAGQDQDPPAYDEDSPPSGEDHLRAGTHPLVRNASPYAVPAAAFFAATQVPTSAQVTEKVDPPPDYSSIAGIAALGDGADGGGD